MPTLEEKTSKYLHFAFNEISLEHIRNKGVDNSSHICAVMSITLLNSAIVNMQFAHNSEVSLVKLTRIVYSISNTHQRSFGYIYHFIYNLAYAFALIKWILEEYLGSMDIFMVCLTPVKVNI